MHSTPPSGDHDLRLAMPWSLDDRAGVALIVLLVPALLVLDYQAGRDFSLHLFYLLPIAISAWTFGASMGLAVAGLSWAFYAYVAFAMRFVGQSTGSAWWEAATGAMLFAGIAVIVSHHRRFVHAAAALARLDHESGALSAREFERLLNVEVRRSRRYNRAFSLMLLTDITRKNAGKPKGFVPALARLAKANIREGDSLARLAEAKFAVLMVECPGEQAIVVAERMRKLLGENFPKLDPAGFAVSLASYGGRTPLSAGDLLQAAEARLNTSRADPGRVSESRLP